VVILRLRLSTILSPLTSSPISRLSDHPSRTSTPWGLILSPLTSSPLSRSAGEGLGGEAPHASPPAPLPFPHRERQREGSIAVVILRLRLSTILSPPTSSPLSRSSDHPSRTSTPWGLILSPPTSSPLSRSAGEGLGVRAPRASPPAPLPFPHRERR